MNFPSQAGVNRRIHVERVKAYDMWGPGSDKWVHRGRATAYGVFNTAIGLALLPASLIMGSIWDHYGSRWAFFASASFSLLGFLIFTGGSIFTKSSD